ncbi:MAG TPA: hypothetical protein VF859_10735, partial [Burkholderiales bacterium]
MLRLAFNGLHRNFHGFGPMFLRLRRGCHGRGGLDFLRLGRETRLFPGLLKSFFREGAGRGLRGHGSMGFRGERGDRCFGRHLGAGDLGLVTALAAAAAAPAAPAVLMGVLGRLALHRSGHDGGLSLGRWAFRALPGRLLGTRFPWLTRLPGLARFAWFARLAALASVLGAAALAALRTLPAAAFALTAGRALTALAPALPSFTTFPALAAVAMPFGTPLAAFLLILREGSGLGRGRRGRLLGAGEDFKETPPQRRPRRGLRGRDGRRRRLGP